MKKCFCECNSGKVFYVETNDSCKKECEKYASRCGDRNPTGLRSYGDTSSSTSNNSKEEVKTTTYNLESVIGKLDIKDFLSSLKINVYATGTFLKRYPSKAPFISFVYNDTQPIQLFINHVNGEIKEGFLYFPKGSLTAVGNKPMPPMLTRGETLYNTSAVIQLQNTQGYFEFKPLKFGKFTTAPTQPQLYKNNEPAFRRLNTPIGGKTHAIQMVFPEWRPIDFNRNTLGFDIDFIFKTGKKIHNKFLIKPDLTNVIENIGNEIPITMVTQRGDGTLPRVSTVYQSLTNNDIERGVVKYDYNSVFGGSFNAYQLLKSEVYIVENTQKYDLSIGGYLDNNTRHLPYNVSRSVKNNEIHPSDPYRVNGQIRYPLNWPLDLRNNKVFTEGNKCLVLKFTSKEQSNAFTQILKQNQIANLETDMYYDINGIIQKKPRFYSNINEWLERSNSDIFSDLVVGYDSSSNLESIEICPSKETVLGEYENMIPKKGTKCQCKFSDVGDDIITTYDVNCSGDDCASCCQQEKERKGWDNCWTCSTDLYAPISDIYTDFFTTTYSPVKEEYSNQPIYTAYTSGSPTGDTTFDIFYSGVVTNQSHSFSATNITVPILLEKTKRKNDFGFVGVNSSKNYIPYTPSQVKHTNNGPLQIRTSSPEDFMSYNVLSGGTYRFMYYAYLDFKYKDNKWCEYVVDNYLSGKTSAYDYPTTQYDVKRLINTSIIQLGEGEDGAVNTGTDGGVSVPAGGLASGSGLTDFDFSVYLEKTSTGGTKTNLASFSVGRSDIFGRANEYLTLDLNRGESMSGFSNCTKSESTGNTIFRKQIPITVDSGLVELMSGETVNLKYDAIVSGTSKVVGGTITVELNVGHKLNVSGSSIESPFYRVIRSATGTTEKNIFFNQNEISEEQYIAPDKTLKTARSQGKLYVVNQNYSPITPPTINDSNFNSNLTFVDNQTDDTTLSLPTRNNKPSNNWAVQLENGKLEDYYINNTQRKLVTMSNGVITFNIPKYNQDYSVRCNYSFPSINHSYVLKNRISNGVSSFDHFIVITPSSNMYIPCFAPPLDEKFDLLQNTNLNDRLITYTNNVINIDGQEIIIRPSRSNPNVNSLNDLNTKCQYYCVCENTRTPNVDPFFGTTNIITKTNIGNCEDCEKEAAIYCENNYPGCKPKILLGVCNTNKDNLYTKGGEYLLPSGKNYIGFYHYHAQTGKYMVGPRHVTTSHETLTPINPITTRTSSRVMVSNNTTYNTSSVGGSSMGGSSGGGGY